MKNTVLLKALLIPCFLIGQNELEIKTTSESRYEFGYSIISPFMVYSSSIPDETFHTSSFFSRDFPFIHPDEPDNYVYIRRVFKKNSKSKWGMSVGLEYLHTKPNRFDEGAGSLSGLYLADGYTQIGPGFGVYYDLSDELILQTVISAGPMLSSPDWEGKEYVPYKVLTPFLVNKYQVTGWGFTQSIGIDYLIGNRFAFTGYFILHYDKSRPLRATDGTEASFHSLIHSFGFGIKYIFRRRTNQK